jgi:hypothetical protein
VFVGVVFLVATPSYGWYAGLLLALAVVAGRPEWSAVALAPTVTYLVYGDLTHRPWPGTLAYVTAGAVVLVTTALRAHRARPALADGPAPQPASASWSTVGTRPRASSNS